jgi:hypothetical protein
MSRSGYVDDMDDQWAMIRWRGAVKAAFRGRRGQAFLKELLAALDALPGKRLIADYVQKNGEVCALGAVSRARGLHSDEGNIEFEEGYNGEPEAEVFGIANCMVQEIVFMNDEWLPRETPERRFTRMRDWITQQIKN